MLARGDRLKADRDMGERHGEVDDDLDLRIGEERLYRFRRNAELGAARLGGGRIEIGDRPHVEDRKGLRRLEIGGADIAAADDADADPVHASSPRAFFPTRSPAIGRGAGTHASLAFREAARRYR